MMDDILDLPMVRGPKDPDRAMKYLERFAQFEEWILAGEPSSDASPDDYPPEHRYMLLRWPDAFEIYRESMWTYLERELQLNPWVATMRSLLGRAREADPKGCAEFIESARQGVDRFWQQHRNAQHTLRGSDRNATERQKIRHALQTYAAFYEIDYPLWVIAVLARSFQTGNVKPTLFGGPATHVAQGNLIGGVCEVTAGTPLGQLLSSAYDADLRNAIGHNDYAIDNLPSGGFEVTDSRTGKVWESDDVYWKLFSTGQFIDGVHTVMAYEHEVNSPDVWQYRDVGTVAATYFWYENREPGVILFQLWCFHRIDPAGTWLDSASLTIETGDTAEEIVRLTDHAWTKGETVTQSAFLEKLEERGWARIVRVPVVPDLGLGFPSFTRPDGAHYCLAGESDVHVIPFAGVREHQGAWPD